MNPRRASSRLVRLLLSVVLTAGLGACGEPGGGGGTSAGTGGGTGTGTGTGGGEDPREEPGTDTGGAVDGAGPSGEADGAGPSEDSATGEPEPEPAADTTGDPEPDVAGEPEPEVLADACPLNSRVGSLQVSHNEFYSAVVAEVKDGVIPLTVLQPVTELEGCHLLQKVNPFCDPTCGGGEVCDHDGTCIPHPINIPVGTVTMTGLLGGDLEMEPNFANYYQGEGVPFPLFEAGASITASASGEGPVPAFALEGVGVPDLTLEEGKIFEMADGVDLSVTWDVAESAGPWRIWFSLNVDQHGNSPVTLFCEVEDDGEHTVPGSMISEMLSYGISGFATMDLYRRTVDSLEIPSGCVELQVFAFAMGKLEVAGHTACNIDPDCPDGQVCQVEINTCVHD